MHIVTRCFFQSGLACCGSSDFLQPLVRRICRLSASSVQALFKNDQVLRGPQSFYSQYDTCYSFAAFTAHFVKYMIIVYPMLFLFNIFFNIGLYVGLSHCQCWGSTDCGLLTNGSGVQCEYGVGNDGRADNVTLSFMNQSCPAAVSGPGQKACTSDYLLPPFNVTIYSCPAAVACFLPPGLTDYAKTNDASCPSRASLLGSLGVYNVLSASFSLLIGTSIEREDSSNSQRPALISLRPY